MPIYFFLTSVREHEFYERRDKLGCSQILSYFDILWATKERTDSSTMETILLSRVHNF